MNFVPPDVSATPLLLTSLAAAVDTSNRAVNQTINVLCVCAAASETIYLKDSVVDRDGVRMKFVDPSIKYHIELAAWGAQAQWPKRCKPGDIALITNIRVSEFRNKRSMKTIYKSKLFVLHKTDVEDDSASVSTDRSHTLMQDIQSLHPSWIRARTREVCIWRNAQSWYVFMKLSDAPTQAPREPSQLHDDAPDGHIIHLDTINQLKSLRSSGKYYLDLTLRSLWFKRISNEELIPDFQRAKLNEIVQLCCSVCSEPLVVDHERIIKACAQTLDCSGAQNVGYEWRPCQMELIDSAGEPILLSGDQTVTRHFLGGLDAAEVTQSVKPQLRNKPLGPLQCHDCTHDQFGLCPHLHPLCQLISVLKAISNTDDDRSSMKIVVEVKIMTDENAEILDQNLRIVDIM